MQIFLLIFFGFLAGVIGGMGMGGGTLLVPLLSFLQLSQKVIQAINLISFLPMSCVALIFHARNKLLKTENIGWLIVPASLCAIVGAFFAGKTDDKILRWCFALFLIVVGLWQMAVAVKFALKTRRRMTVVYSSVRCLKAKTRKQNKFEKIVKNS